MHTATFHSWHTTLLFLAMEVLVHYQDKQKAVAADQTKVPPLTGPECYFCRDNKNCSMPLENLDSVTCQIGSICAFINVTAEFPGSASSADIARGCAPDTFGADVCISSAEYIEDILIPKFPEVKDTIVSNSGAACFCSEDFCNAEIPEGLLCYTCDGEDECSQSLGLLLVETCPLNSVCGIVNITADLGVPEPAKDVKRGCFSTFSATGCMTSDEYIQVATAHDANITDFIISTEGIACFCDEDFCNTEIEDLSETSSVPSAAPLETTLFALPDPCKPNPCQNGGICNGYPVDFPCTCMSGYIGNTCEGKEQTSEPLVRETSSMASNSPTESSSKVALLTAILTFVVIIIIFVVAVLVFRDFTTWKGSQRTCSTRKPGNFRTYLSKTPLRILPRMKKSTNVEGLTIQSSTQPDWESKC